MIRTSRSTILYIAWMATLLVGCSGSTFEPALGLGSGRSTPQVRVAVVPPGFTSPFHVAVKNGATQAASELGWQVDVVAAESEDDFAGQVVVVEQEIQKGVAAIGVNPIDAEAIVTAVKDANQAHVPVFMQNLITPVGKGNVIEYIGYDQWNGAAQLAEYSCSLLKGKGAVFILTGIPGFHANRRTGGFKWGLHEYCPAVKVVGEQTAEWDREKALNIATAALEQHPEIDLFYGNSDEMDIGACIAAKKLGRTVNKDIYCLGIDGNPVTLDLIEKGDVTATLGVYPDKIGYVLIKQMAKFLQGERVPRILETPALVVDKGNLNDYRAGRTWTEPKEGEAELDNGLPSGTQ
jgi:ABC-type sugar transport system substrate-binding protein